jgi:FCD domain
VSVEAVLIGQRAFVAEVSAESIAEIASLRKRLEPYAIELALPRLRGATRIKVTRPLEDMTIGADTNDAAATINAHMGFHRAFYELSGHKLCWISGRAGKLSCSCSSRPTSSCSPTYTTWSPTINGFWPSSTPVT